MDAGIVAQACAYAAGLPAPAAYDHEIGHEDAQLRPQAFKGVEEDRQVLARLDGADKQDEGRGRETIPAQRLFIGTTCVGVGVSQMSEAVPAHRQHRDGPYRQ